MASSFPEAAFLDRFGTFRTKVYIGFLAIMALLGGGLLLAFERYANEADNRLAAIQEIESRVTLAEQLRWSGTATVAAARGYLFAHDSGLLDELRRANASSERTLSTLRKLVRYPRGQEVLGRIEKASAAYHERVEVLFAARGRGASPAKLADEFDETARPLRHELELALDDLVALQHELAAHEYARVKQERTAWRLRTLLFAVFLFLLTFGVATFFAKLLAQMYQKEAFALKKAETATAVRDEVLSIMAHDLRNPLTAVSLKVARLERLLAFEGVHEEAASIQDIVARMNQLIGSMLDLGKIEAGSLTLSRQPCRVKHLLEDALKVSREVAGTKNIAIEVRLPDQELVVLADRPRVLQVISNLVGNALKFSPVSGRICLQAEANGADIRFCVRDWGPGVPEDAEPNLFDRYFTGDTSGRGTGLGLFIAKGIVVAHGGRIWHQRPQGQGAEFCFTLPAASRTTEPIP